MFLFYPKWSLGELTVILHSLWHITTTRASSNSLFLLHWLAEPLS